MHATAMANMQEFKRKYVKEKSGLVLDIGSLDINGSFRGCWDGWDYKGIDIVPGPNVDYVLEDPYTWPFIADVTADVIISGQAFEHIADDMAVMREIARGLKPGGLCCIIAPSAGPEQGYPKDYRRYTPGSLSSLAKAAGLEVLEAKVNGTKPWYDCVMVAKKPGSMETQKPRGKKNEG